MLLLLLLLLIVVELVVTLVDEVVVVTVDVVELPVVDVVVADVVVVIEPSHAPYAGWHPEMLEQYRSVEPQYPHCEQQRLLVHRAPLAAAPHCGEEPWRRIREKLDELPPSRAPLYARPSRGNASGPLMTEAAPCPSRSSPANVFARVGQCILALMADLGVKAMACRGRAATLHHDQRTSLEFLY